MLALPLDHPPLKLSLPSDLVLVQGLLVASPGRQLAGPRGEGGSRPMVLSQSHAASRIDSTCIFTVQWVAILLLFFALPLAVLHLLGRPAPRCPAQELTGATWRFGPKSPGNRASDLEIPGCCRWQLSQLHMAYLASLSLRARDEEFLEDHRSMPPRHVRHSLQVQDPAVLSSRCLMGATSRFTSRRSGTSMACNQAGTKPGGGSDAAAPQPASLRHTATAHGLRAGSDVGMAVAYDRR